MFQYIDKYWKLCKLPPFDSSVVAAQWNGTSGGTYLWKMIEEDVSTRYTPGQGRLRLIVITSVMRIRALISSIPFITLILSPVATAEKASQEAPSKYRKIFANGREQQGKAEREEPSCPSCEKENRSEVRMKRAHAQTSRASGSC